MLLQQSMYWSEKRQRARERGERKRQKAIEREKKVEMGCKHAPTAVRGEPLETAEVAKVKFN